MQNNIKGAGLLAAALFCAALTGCPKDQPAGSGANQPNSGGTAGPTTPSGAKRYKIAVIPKGTENQFWLSIYAGAKKACQDENIDEPIWKGPNPEGNIEDQINIMQAQVTNKVDGIVLASIDATALITPVKNAIAKGIPVVTVDSGIKDDSPSAYIATDNVKGGAKAGEELAKVIGDKGEVGLLIFKKGSVSSDEREKGFKDEIAKHPNIKLVSTLEAGDATKALDAATNMMTANPKIAGIFAASEPNGVGAAQVLKQRKLGGKVKVVAFDSSDKELTAIQDGSIQALIVQDPFQMGYLGIKTVLKAIKKEPITEKNVDSGFTVVTAANLKDPKVDALLHPKK